MTNYVIVRNAQPRIFPRWLRARLGELYMGVDIDPFFTSDYAEARIFPSLAWAESYLYDRDGRVRSGMRECVIRPVRDAHTIYASIERKESNAATKT
jgi:hypothetical protein